MKPYERLQLLSFEPQKGNYMCMTFSRNDWFDDECKMYQLIKQIEVLIRRLAKTIVMNCNIVKRNNIKKYKDIKT